MKEKGDSLKKFRKEVYSEITKQYPSIEKFCFENDISKSILSKLINGKQGGFELTTLDRIAKALHKSVEVRLK